MAIPSFVNSVGLACLLYVLACHMPDKTLWNLQLTLDCIRNALHFFLAMYCTCFPVILKTNGVYFPNLVKRVIFVTER
jgi:hypothetical protein